MSEVQEMGGIVGVGVGDEEAALFTHEFKAPFQHLFAPQSQPQVSTCVQEGGGGVKRLQLSTQPLPNCFQVNPADSQACCAGGLVGVGVRVGVGVLVNVGQIRIHLLFWHPTLQLPLYPTQ